MISSSIRTHRHRAVAAALALACTVGVAACGSDAKTPPKTEAGASTSVGSAQPTSPEDHKADDATVTKGLASMAATTARIAAQVAAGAKVSDASDQLEADWKTVEGTVNTKEPDIYLNIEEGINGIGKAAAAGDVAVTTKFSTELASAISQYTAKHE